MAFVKFKERKGKINANFEIVSCFLFYSEHKMPRQKSSFSFKTFAYQIIKTRHVTQYLQNNKKRTGKFQKFNIHQ